MVKIIKVRLTTNLKRLIDNGACQSGLDTLINSLPKNHSKIKQINLLHILESNGLDHFFWALKAVIKPNKRIIRLILADAVKLIGCMPAPIVRSKQVEIIKKYLK